LLHAVGAEDYEGLKFVPRPGAGLVESEFPIFAIWQANRHTRRAMRQYASTRAEAVCC